MNYFTAYFAYWKAGLLQPAAEKQRREFSFMPWPVEWERPRSKSESCWASRCTAPLSEEKLARVKTLGLQHGINYKQRDYETAIKELTHGEGVDAVFEMLGGEHTAKGVRCLRDFGRVIVYGAATGQPAHLDARILYAKGASVHGLWLTYLSAKRELMNQAWKQLSAWIAQGHLRPVIGHVFPLEKAVEAYRCCWRARTSGR